MKKTEAMKKLLSILLSLCMLLQFAPVTALAAAEDGLCEHHSVHTDECGYVEGVSDCAYSCEDCLGQSQEETEPDVTEAVQEVSESTTVTETVSPEVDLPANDELFAMYAEQKLYGNEWATYGTAARANLNPVEQAFYDALKAEIEKVAASGGSTHFALTEVSGLKTEWTREELGVESIGDDQVKAAVEQFKAQFNTTNIVRALLGDCPFDLYWYDKTEGAALSFSYGRSGQSVNGTTYWTKVSFTEMYFTFKVAPGYQGNDNITVITDVAKVSTAKTNAQSIVNSHAGKSDYEKLLAYKDEICAWVSYNHAAAEDTYTGGYGDPWQLIYVFDGDAATEVVCEGYAKAFQYLCDLSGLSCISVTGQLTSGTGAGGHMWNVVALDGANYLVDVTNCDDGTIGAPDKLFLVGNADGSVAEGYYFTISGQRVGFIYDSDITGTWAESQLKLADGDYELPAPCTHNWENGTCTLCGEACTHSGGTATCTEKAVCETCGSSYGDPLGHTFTDGICTRCGMGIAHNPATGESYGTVAAALAAAVSGQTVALQSDAEESRVLVQPGVTLDLNGHTLTADYLVGFNTSAVCDSSNNEANGYEAKGLLAVAPENLVLYESNGAVPVYNPEKGGFIFVDFLFKSVVTQGENGTTVDMLVTSRTMEVIDLLKDGASDNDIQVIVRLNWDNATGTAYQDFVFNETTIQRVMQSNGGSYGVFGRMFFVNITGLEALANVKATVMIVSGSNAVDQAGALKVN